MASFKKTVSILFKGYLRNQSRQILIDNPMDQNK